MGSLSDMASLYEMETKVLELDNRVSNIESALRNIVNQRFKILKASNKHIKILINKMEGSMTEKVIIIFFMIEGILWIAWMG